MDCEIERDATYFGEQAQMPGEGPAPSKRPRLAEVKLEQAEQVWASAALAAVKQEPSAAPTHPQQRPNPGKPATRQLAKSRQTN